MISAKIGKQNGDTRTRKSEPGYLNLSIGSRSARCNQQYINTAKISYTNFRMTSLLTKTSLAYGGFPVLARSSSQLAASDA
jgi:hypothetical protein